MITFCGFSYRSSGIVRGMQLQQNIRGSEFLDVDNLAGRRPENEVVIYVRKIDDRHAMLCKKSGYKIGYDVADNPVTDIIRGFTEDDDFSRYVRDYIDFYIVNNDLVKSELQKKTDKKIYVIPHHNCNFKKIHNSPRTPKTIGYIGLPEQSITAEELSPICRKLDLQFFNKDITTHSELVDAFSSIDIGMVFFNQSADEKRRKIQEKILKYKPGTKLSNFQSYGIPTVCLPYESFKQFGSNQCIFVNDFEELVSGLERLVTDHHFYGELSERSIEAGEKLHISEVVKYYEQIARDMTSL